MQCAIAAAGHTLKAAPRRGITGWDLLVLAVANGVAVTGLWWRQRGLAEVHDLAGLLTSLGRVTGLLGAYLALVQLLLLARIPVLAGFGLDRVARWHRRNGIACLALLVAHTALITAGYTLTDRVALSRQVADLLGRYEGVLLATIGLVLLVAVVVTSAVAVRRRLGARAWHAVHLTGYAAIALAFSHQLATGRDFQGQPVARAYWWALYGATVAALIGVRVVRPVWRSLRHRLHVARVVQEAPGAVSVEIGGENLDRLGVAAGQSLHWRFLAPGHWHHGVPLSLSAAPRGERLRITARRRPGADLSALRPGTRVIADGPFGGLPEAARTRARVALIAGGIGITPVRALLEDLPGGPGDVAVIHAAGPGETLLRDELDDLAARRGAALHRVDPGALSPERLCDLVPDLADRDVFVCGPRSMTAPTRESLVRAGVPPARITCESMGL